ncbi:MAG: GNAT family N-acetyltransferase [Jatrophihabitantaceae bacterium]
MVEIPGWRVERLPITHPDAAMLVEEVQEEYTLRYGSRDETPIDSSYFDEPLGAFFVGYFHEKPAVTGAWRRRTDVVFDGTSQSAEVKRMYVAPGARRAGLARAMLAHLEDTARASGAEVMVLETGMRQPEAITLYESAGYGRVPGFGFYKDEPLSRCFAKRISERRG